MKPWANSGEEGKITNSYVGYHFKGEGDPFFSKVR